MSPIHGLNENLLFPLNVSPRFLFANKIHIRVVVVVLDEGGEEEDFGSE